MSAEAWAKVAEVLDYHIERNGPTYAYDRCKLCGSTWYGPRQGREHPESEAHRIDCPLVAARAALRAYAGGEGSLSPDPRTHVVCAKCDTPRYLHHATFLDHDYVEPQVSESQVRTVREASGSEGIAPTVRGASEAHAASAPSTPTPKCATCGGSGEVMRFGIEGDCPECRRPLVPTAPSVSERLARLEAFCDAMAAHFGNDATPRPSLFLSARTYLGSSSERTTP